MRRPDRQYAVLGLSEQDIANVVTVTEAMPAVRNHAVAIRPVLAREAKRLRSERPRQGALDEVLDERLNAEEPQ